MISNNPPGIVDTRPAPEMPERSSTQPVAKAA